MFKSVNGIKKSFTSEMNDAHMCILFFAVFLSAFSAVCFSKDEAACDLENRDSLLEGEEVVVESGSNLRVGLAFSGGGARGAAHLGVLKVLLEEKIPIHMVSGTSMGAAVAAYYASDPDIDNLIKKGQEGMARFIPEGMFKKIPAPQFLWEVLNFFYGDLLLEELPIPCVISAFDLKRWRVAMLKEGSVKMAVWASCAIPFIMPLPEFNGTKYMDAMVFCRIPAKPLFDMGADVVIASIIPPFPLASKFLQDIVIPGMAPGFPFTLEFILNYFFPSPLPEKVLIPIYIMIPEVGGLNFARAEDCIAKGERAARAAIPRIKRIIQKLIEK